MKELREGILLNHKGKVVITGTYETILNMPESSQVEKYYFYSNEAFKRFMKKEIDKKYAHYAIEQFIF